MERRQIKDPVKAQAAIAVLAANGWKFDLEKVNSEIPGGLQDADWIKMANWALNYVLDVMAEDKVIPISQFRH